MRLTLSRKIITIPVLIVMLMFTTHISISAKASSASNLCRIIRLLDTGIAHEGAWPFTTTADAIQALTRYAQAEAATAHYQNAIKQLDCLIRWQAYPAYYALRGQMHLGLYQWDQALTDFNIAVSHQPDHAPHYYQRGVLYYSILQTGIETRPAALSDFERYLQLAPNGPYAEQAQAYAESILTELAVLGD